MDKKMDFNQLSNIYTSESVCFNKDEFMKENFNPDTFVKVFQATRPEGLDRLRDDLGIYLKILRSAMIDLINRDYADFVNLSTNLTGFDLVIDALKTPLGQLQEEVMSVDRLISDAIESIENDLQKRHLINQEKVILHKLSLISMRLEHLEALLKSEREKGATEEPIEVGSPDELVNRVAIQVNQLNFLVSECHGASLLDSLMPRVNTICLFVEKGLEKSLREGIKGDKALLVRTLRTYANLGTTEHAHEQTRYLIRECLIPVISDAAMKSDPKGLRGIYEKALVAVQQITNPLLAALAEGKQDNTCGFSFLECSAFPEIVDAVIERLPAIFNPAIPTAFYQKYTESMKFIKKLESLIGSYDKIVKFRNQPHYVKFMDQWNLPVYFQIRYREIGLVVEASLSCEGSGLRESHSNSDFLLASTQAVYDGIQKCFRVDSFLLALLHRFWKLFLLILSRHRTFIEEKINLLRKNAKLEATHLQKKNEESSMEPSLESLKIDGRRVIGGIEAAIFIFSDINTLSSKLDHFYHEFVHTQVAHMDDDRTKIMKDSIQNQIEALVAMKAPLLEVMTEICTIAASTPLRLVGDTPRLYRRTNKAVPQLHQSYVETCVRPLQLFFDLSRNRLPQSDVRLTIENVFSSTFSQYYKHTYEVLNSVHKMEESLKKLKRARDRGSQQASDSSSGPTDDDKIRIQIFIDVKFIQDKLSSLGIEADQIASFGPLLDMVTHAKEGTFHLK